jgi:hypothetical protein
MPTERSTYSAFARGRPRIARSPRSCCATCSNEGSIRSERGCSCCTDRRPCAPPFVTSSVRSPCSSAARSKSAATILVHRPERLHPSVDRIMNEARESANARSRGATAGTARLLPGSGASRRGEVDPRRAGRDAHAAAARDRGRALPDPSQHELDRESQRIDRDLQAQREALAGWIDNRPVGECGGARCNEVATVSARVTRVEVGARSSGIVWLQRRGENDRRLRSSRRDCATRPSPRCHVHITAQRAETELPPSRWTSPRSCIGSRVGFRLEVLEVTGPGLRTLRRGPRVPLGRTTR